MEPIDPHVIPNDVCQLKDTTIFCQEGHSARKAAVIPTYLHPDIPAYHASVPQAMEQQDGTSQGHSLSGAAADRMIERTPQVQAPLASRAVFRPVASTAARAATVGAPTYPAYLTLPSYRNSQLIFPAVAGISCPSGATFHASAHPETMIKAELQAVTGSDKPRPRLYNSNEGNDDVEGDVHDADDDGEDGEDADDHHDEADDGMETGSDVGMDGEHENGDKPDNSAHAPLLPQAYIDAFLPTMLMAAAACRRKRSAWGVMGTTGVAASFPGRSRVATTWSRLELEHLARVSRGAADCSEEGNDDVEVEDDDCGQLSDGGSEDAAVVGQRVGSSGGGQQGWGMDAAASQVAHADVDAHLHYAREEPLGLAHAVAPTAPSGAGTHAWNVQCSKSDSKGWRCKKLAAPGKKYCPHHLPPTRKQVGKHGKHGRGPVAKARHAGGHAVGAEEAAGSGGGPSPRLGSIRHQSLEEDAGPGEVVKFPPGRGRRTPWETPGKPSRMSQDADGGGDLHGHEHAGAADGGEEDDDDGGLGSRGLAAPRKAGPAAVDGSGDAKLAAWDDVAGRGARSREATPLGLQKPVPNEDDRRNPHGLSGAKQGRRGGNPGWVAGGSKKDTGLGAIPPIKAHAAAMGSVAGHTCRRKQARPMRAGEGGHDEGVMVLRRDLTLLHLLLQIGGKGGCYPGGYGGGKALTNYGNSGSYGQGVACGRDRESGQPLSPSPTPTRTPPRSPMAGGGANAKGRPGSGRPTRPVDDHDDDDDGDGGDEEEDEGEDEEDVVGEGEDDEESSRCHRTNGKQWRCRHAAMPGKHYCEHHLLARRRSACPTALPWAPPGRGDAAGGDVAAGKRGHLAMTAGGNGRHTARGGGGARGPYRGRGASEEWAASRSRSHDSDAEEVEGVEEHEAETAGYRNAKRARGRPRTHARSAYSGDGRKQEDRDAGAEHEGSDAGEVEDHEECVRYREGAGRFQHLKGRDGYVLLTSKGVFGSHDLKRPHSAHSNFFGRPMGGGGHESITSVPAGSSGLTPAAADTSGGAAGDDAARAALAAAGVGRCQRMDGKRWRCSRPTQGDKMYCAHHLMQRFSARPRKRQPGAAGGATRAPASIPSTPQHSGEAAPDPGRGPAAMNAAAGTRTAAVSSEGRVVKPVAIGAKGEVHASRAATLLDMLAYAVDPDGPSGDGSQGEESLEGPQFKKRRTGLLGPGFDDLEKNVGGVPDGAGLTRAGRETLRPDEPRQASAGGYVAGRAMSTVPEEEEEEEDGEGERASGLADEDEGDGEDMEEDVPSPARAAAHEEDDKETGHSPEGRAVRQQDGGRAMAGFLSYSKGRGASGAHTPAASNASDDGSSCSISLRGVSQGEISSDHRKGEVVLSSAPGERSAGLAAAAGVPRQGKAAHVEKENVGMGENCGGVDQAVVAARDQSAKAAAVANVTDVAALDAPTAVVSARSTLPVMVKGKADTLSVASDAAHAMAVVAVAAGVVAPSTAGPSVPAPPPPAQHPVEAQLVPQVHELSVFVQEEQLRAAMLLQHELNHSGGAGALSSVTDGSGDDSALWRACASGSGSASGSEGSSEGSEGSESELARHLRQHPGRGHRHAGAGHGADLVMPRFLRRGDLGDPLGGQLSCRTPLLCQEELE